MLAEQRITFLFTTEDKMAISKDYVTDQGVDCPHAYIMISDIQYNKFPFALDITNPSPTTLVNVGIYYSQATREAKQKPLMTKTFGFNADTTGNVWEQAYVALKGLPDMAGAVDV